jgi:hypothetical protein
VLREKRKVLGGRHLEIARTLHPLAALLAERGLVAEATKLAREALELRIELLGEDSPLAEEMQGLLHSIGDATS